MPAHRAPPGAWPTAVDSFHMEDVRGQRCVLLKFGELALKGRNRPLFIAALERNLRRLTADLGPLEVRHRGGVFIVTANAPEDELVENRFTLVSLDAYTGDYVEVRLFGARGAELARESLYEDE